MKKILFILLIIYSVVTRAFGVSKIDSIYYLLDTAKTQINDRLWDIHEEYPSLKIYIIKCPCLPFDNQPTFIENTGVAPNEIISKKKILGLKFISLERLISMAKQIATDNEKKNIYSFFFIEPTGNEFVLHHVRLHNLTKPRGPSKDFIVIPGH